MPTDRGRSEKNVDNKPIRTEVDHRAALADIESLMTARPATADGDHLDALVTRVEVFEREHFPMDGTRCPAS